ncbi:MAG TPA: helix-turn-helix domain-containing protein [Myxococcaceae bacterium]|nr:helix-turn-helix domain-containing protein [Myxococcaceae bacterium]
MSRRRSRVQVPYSSLRNGPDGRRKSALSPGSASPSPGDARKGPRKKSEDPGGVVDGLLSVHEVASLLRVHPSTVYGLCERGQLVHIRVSNAIRIAAEDVRAFLRSRRTDASSPSTGATVSPDRSDE